MNEHVKTPGPQPPGPEAHPTGATSSRPRDRKLQLRGMGYAAQATSLSPVQRRAAGAGGAASDVHSVAAAGVAGSGGTLPYAAAIQRSFGPRYDISGIKAHVGGAGAASCDAIGAEGYATGSDVAFRASPDLHTAAHEATHVLQQKAGVQLYGGLGQVGDTYERHADAVADRVVSGESATDLLDAMPGGGSAATSVVQRAAKQTNYGTFTDEKNAINGNKLDFTLKFTPNDKVDATKIGLSQTVRNLKNGNIMAIDPTAGGRMTGDGTRIDRISTRNTPVYGSDDIGGGDLTTTSETNAPDPNDVKLNPDDGLTATYQLGHRHDPGTGWVTQDAGLYDAPSLGGGANSCKEFETAALGLAGTMAGEYMGSVKWGWTKDENGIASEIEFDVVSMGVPSDRFLEAAEMWNDSTTRGTMQAKADGTSVYRRVGGVLTEVFTIDAGEKATYLGNKSARDGYYARIRMNEGAHVGQEGRVRVEELEDVGDGGQTANLPVNPIALTFQVDYHTEPGQDIYVVGDHPELGAWDPSKALKLGYVDEHTWSGQVKLSPNKATKAIEYKYILKKGSKVERWEEGGNHRPGDLPAAGASKVYRDAWDDGK